MARDTTPFQTRAVMEVDTRAAGSPGVHTTRNGHRVQLQDVVVRLRLNELLGDSRRTSASGRKSMTSLVWAMLGVDDRLVERLDFCLAGVPAIGLVAASGEEVEHQAASTAES